MKTDQFCTVKTLAEKLALKPLTFYRLIENLKRDRNEAIGAVLVLLLLSGCSTLDNSERYYKNRPYQPINYRTYNTD